MHYNSPIHYIFLVFLSPNHLDGNLLLIADV